MVSGFDFIYSCPLLRDFPPEDFIRVSFGNKVPVHVITKVLGEGILCEDPARGGQVRVRNEMKFLLNPSVPDAPNRAFRSLKSDWKN